MAELAPQVVSERRALERAEKELARLRELKEVRGQRWTTQVQLQQKIISWITEGGIPPNTALADVEDAAEAKLLRKNERIADGVERYRHRLRELAADRHRINSAPYPSAGINGIKAKLRRQIEQLAEQGAPNVDDMIEHNAPLTFAMTSSRSLVRRHRGARVGDQREHRCAGAARLLVQRRDDRQDRNRDRCRGR